jgi:hypothetical protein
MTHKLETLWTIDGKIFTTKFPKPEQGSFAFSNLLKASVLITMYETSKIGIIAIKSINMTACSNVITVKDYAGDKIYIPMSNVSMYTYEEK